MTAPTPEEILQGLNENAGAPYGTARNARAEALSAAAEATKDPALYRRALNDLIDAYEWSSERTRMVVPFARLVQEYDRDPSSFAPHEVHNLYWQFKWVAGRIVESPEIPLETVDRWLADMRRRYRLAGFSERAVHQAEFHLADATGDEARMERSMAGWTAADRDGMSDCHACELNTQGWFSSRTGDDDRAIEIWEPVLSGGMSCMEEPHRVLAHSLLPLVRLGRLSDARAHHLRGYRLARGKESLLRSVGEHIEFCALTGNESRGLEILAEHASHLGPLADVEAQMEFAAGVLVLLRRLRNLGLGDRPAALYQGTGRTADELYHLLYEGATAIAARFDARNGTTLVSERLAERIGREPLVETLPLGVRGADLPGPAPASAPGAAVRGGAPASGTSGAGSGGPFRAGRDAGLTGPDDGDLAGLIEQAREARRRGRPAARTLWAEVVRRTGAGEEVADPELAGDLLEYRATAATDADDPEGRELFARAIEAHRAAGRPSRAAYALLADAGAATRLGAEPEEIRALLTAAVRAAGDLDETEPERPRRMAQAELARIRIESFLLDRERAETTREEPENSRSAAALEAFVTALSSDPGVAVTGPGGHADVLAQAELTLARLALSTGDLAAADTLLTAAARGFLTAERPWLAVEPLGLRASVLASGGDLDGAESTARTALGHAAESDDVGEQAGIRLTLAEILLCKGGQAEEAARHALDAAHRLDRAGLAATGGTRARVLLSRAYAEAGRTAEAAEILLSALPDLVEHDEEGAVEARQTLGGLLRELHDPEAAAEQYLLAAETASTWDNPRPQAVLAHAAAEALAAADMLAESRSAYARALELWQRAGDNPVGEVRVLRSMAWLAVEGEPGEEDYGRARALMDRAFAVVQDSDRPELRYEWAQTCQQLAHLLENSLHCDAEEAFGGPVRPGDHTMSRDSGDSRDSGPEDFHDGGEARENAAEVLSGTVDREDAAVREQTVRLLDQAASVYRELGGSTLPDRFQCLVRAAEAERELGRAPDGAARIAALISELDGMEGDTAAGLLRRAELIHDRM
ncbi:hypothetical protein ACFYT4_23415 [Streptomyces sp. NPDC004609]|uniref:hypothetical protein n=1 Tax=Streptomyces sp. NPDC004609 TaxID=3364704 RepID=UPI00368CA1FA